MNAPKTAGPATGSPTTGSPTEILLSALEAVQVQARDVEQLMEKINVNLLGEHPSSVVEGSEAPKADYNGYFNKCQGIVLETATIQSNSLNLLHQLLEATQ